MTLLGFDALGVRAVDGGVETLDSVLETRREEVFFEFPMTVCHAFLVRRSKIPDRRVVDVGLVLLRLQRSRGCAFATVERGGCSVGRGEIG